MKQAAYDDVNATVEALRYEVFPIPNTAQTIAVAIAPNTKVIGVGLAGCIDPADYDPEVGKTVAIAKAKADASTTLWTIKAYNIANEIPN